MADSSLLSLLGSERSDGKEEERSIWCQKARKRGVEGEEGSDDSKSTTGGVNIRITAELPGRQTDEGWKKEQEDGEQGDTRPCRGNEEYKGDENPRCKVEPECVWQLRLGGTRVCVEDSRVWPVDEGERDPERSVRCKGCCSERVTRCKLPHSSKELCQSSVGEREPDNHVRGRDSPSASVVEGQDKGGTGEGHQAERGRVGKLSVEDGETGLGRVEGVASWSDAPLRHVSSTVAILKLNTVVGSDCSAVRHGLRLARDTSWMLDGECECGRR